MYLYNICIYTVLFCFDHFRSVVFCSQALKCRSEVSLKKYARLKICAAAQAQTRT